MKNKWIIIVLAIIALYGITSGVKKLTTGKNSSFSFFNLGSGGGSGGDSNPTHGTQKNGPDGVNGVNGEGAISGTSSTGTGANGVATTEAPTETGKAGAAPGAVATAPAPDKNCFAVEYRHTQEAKAKDIEDFLDYQNAFPLPHANVNQKSICVKVNNKPVAFKISKFQSADEVMIGSVVGPESVIRVSYCLAKAPCKESCQIAGNRMMDDLMSDTGEDDDFKDSWDADEGNEKGVAKNDQKKELKARVKELRAVASENTNLNSHSVIRTWETVQKQEWVCNK